MHEAKVVRFEGFEVHPAQRLVLIDGRPRALGSRAFDLLLALVARRGRLVAKAELMDAIWSGAAVGANNLAVQLSSLRKALGANVVATVPGRGYRLAATPLDDAARPDDLIGRAEDARALHALLDAFRLVTLVGPGGVGKTRLARHVAESRAGRLPNGAYVVDLAPLTDPAQVADAIAARLGLAEAESDDRLDRLIAALASRQMLLLLDGADHLADAVAEVAARLLASVPGLRLLVTSLAPLQLRQEQVARLDGLALPDGRVDSAQAAQHSAVALFVARAYTAHPGFTLDNDNVDAVVDFCRRVDGLPLAIEMAAARLHAHGVQDLSTLVGDPLQLANANDAAAPSRHRTLRATLERSLELLGPTERASFRRLGVFLGGFTLGLGSRIAAASLDDSAHWEALDVLGVLVDRSLVIADADDPPLYRLSAPTRAFALEQLAASGEQSAVRTQHARALRQYLEGMSAGCLAYFDDANRWLAAETADVLAALDWSVDHDPETAKALGPLLSRLLVPGTTTSPILRNS